MPRRDMATNEMAKREAGRARKHEEERIRIEPFLAMQRAAKDGVVESPPTTPSMKTPAPNPAAYPAAAAVVAAQKGPPAWAC